MKEELPSVDQLLDLPLPAPVSYWPHTWGWAAVVVVAAVAAVVSYLLVARRRRRNRYRREALELLAVIELEARTDPQAARGLPTLLKRVGLSAMPGTVEIIRPLRGQAWVDFMNRTGKRTFPPDTATLLNTLAYAPPSIVATIPATQLQVLLAASRDWVEHHHVAA